MRRIAFAYSMFILVWSLLRLTGLADWGPFELFDVFGSALFLPMPVIVIASVARRRWDALAVLIAPMLVLVVEYGPQFAPHRVPGGEPLRVVTSNLYVDNKQFTDAEEVLMRLRADVVALQELSTTMSQGISKVLRRQFPHQSLYPRDDIDGMGVLSRFPMREVRRPQMSAGSCRCQVVEIAFEKKRFTLVNVHPRPPLSDEGSFDTSRQGAVVDALLAVAREAKPRVVVSGDLNISDRHRLYRRIRGPLGDSFRDAGWGLGFTWGPRRRIPLVRIDYVFHDDRWKTKSARTGVLPGSDHRFVTAELVLSD